jgi:hypothetical protein
MYVINHSRIHCDIMAILATRTTHSLVSGLRHLVCCRTPTCITSCLGYATPLPLPGATG